MTDPILTMGKTIKFSFIKREKKNGGEGIIEEIDIWLNVLLNSIKSKKKKKGCNRSIVKIF